MWINKSYYNSKWNPARGSMFTINGVTYIITGVTIGSNRSVWSFVQKGSRFEYEMEESELYHKLGKYGIL